MAAERVWQTYTSDDGVIYLVFIPGWMGSITPALGFGSFDPTKSTLPRGIKMRYLTCTDASTGRHRRLHVGAVTSGAWTTLGLPVTLPDIAGSTEVYVTTGRIGEKTIRQPHG